MVANGLSTEVKTTDKAHKKTSKYYRISNFIGVY